MSDQDRKVRGIACGPNGGAFEFDAPDMPKGKTPGRCVHYTGIYGPGMKKHTRCEAGVRYEDVRLDHEPVQYKRDGVTYTERRSWPCCAALNVGGLATCEKLTWPTTEEIAHDKAYTAEIIKRMSRASAAASPEGSPATTEDGR